jgi:hypothetical protein
MTGASGQVAEVPSLTGANELAASVRARADDAALRDDRLPHSPLSAVFAIVVQEPLFWPATRELMGVTAKALVTRSRHEDPAAEVTLARRKHNPRRQPGWPPLPPLRTPLRAIPLIAVMRIERSPTRTKAAGSCAIAHDHAGREKFRAGVVRRSLHKKELHSGLLCCLQRTSLRVHLTPWTVSRWDLD